MKQTIRNHLQLIYDGDPWYGSSMKTVLESINPKIIFDSPGNGMHSIIELSAHMLAYRKFTEQRLQGSTDAPLGQEQTFNWRNFSSNKKKVWEIMTEEIHLNQQSLLLLLDRLEDAVLDQQVPGKKYSFYYLLNGIVQHDLYHLGQIVYINKMLGKERNNSPEKRFLQSSYRIFPYEHLARIK